MRVSRLLAAPVLALGLTGGLSGCSARDVQAAATDRTGAARDVATAAEQRQPRRKDG